MEQSNTKPPLATILIRARNEEALIGDCLKSIFSQKAGVPFEVIVIDCQSLDKTRDIAIEYDIRLYSIPPKLFTYSSALNLGIELSRGKYILPLSAHAVPKDKNWLMFHVEHLENNPEVAGTYSKQVGWDGLTDIEDKAIKNNYPTVSSSYNKKAVADLIQSGTEPYKALPFSNASSCIRLEDISEVGFKEMPFSEDRAFALDTILNGKSISYLATAEVYHSHYPKFRTFYEEARRATISRGLVNKSYQDNTKTKMKDLLPESRLYLYLKLFPLALLTIMKIIMEVPRGTFLSLIRNKNRKAKSKRVIDFYVASFGTTLGKIRGIWEFQRVKEYTLTRADSHALRDSLTKLK